MTAKISAATERALARVAAGETAYAAAKAEGISLSTIYRARARIARASGILWSREAMISRTQQAIALVLDGMSQHAAAKKIGVSPSAVCRALQVNKMQQRCPTCGQPTRKIRLGV